MTKICTRCKKELPLSEFYIKAKEGNRLFSRCKSCCSEVTKAKQDENLEHFREIKRKSALKNRDKRLVRQRARSKEVRSKQGSEYYKQHKESVDAKNKLWRNENVEKCRAYWRNRKARILDSGGEISAEEWASVLDFYGNKCLRCGRSDVLLTQDHVVPLSLGGKHSIENIQPLCSSCNSWKHTKTIDYRSAVYL